MEFTLNLGGVLAAMSVTGFLSVAVARYLSMKLLDHRLSKDLKDYDASINQKLATYKAGLDQQLNEAKAASEARWKKELDEYLGERSVERAYRAEARKRLYVAVGPLRFQLFAAASEFANRVARIADDKVTYDMSLDRYFGQSTIYRLVRVLAVSELIERQVAYADFAVDPEIRVLLKFKRQAYLTLSSHRVSLGHPKENWAIQEQHIFYDVIGIIASSLIVQDAPTSPSRVVRFDEFAKMISERGGMELLSPIPRLFTGFSVEKKQILWLRMVALAHLCEGLLNRLGSEIGLETEALDVELLLKASRDPYLVANCERYRKAMLEFRTAIDDALVAPASAPLGPS